MRALYRWPISFLAACLASIPTSMQLCGWALQQPTWPPWADFICGHNTPLMWMVSVPILTIAFNRLMIGWRKQLSRK